MNTPEKKELTIIGLKINNYKRLKAVSLKLTPTGLTEIRGRNDQGKTSVIDCILEMLGVIKVPEPIRTGQDEWDGWLDLGDIKITKKGKVGGVQKLVITNADGSQKYNSPAKLLERLVSKFVDPIKFIGLSELEQTRAILGMLDLAIDLDASKASEEALKADRTIYNRELKTVKGQVAELAQQLEGKEVAVVDMSVLTAKLTNAVKTNAAIDETMRESERLHATLEEKNRALEIATCALSEAQEELSIAGANVETASAAVADNATALGVLDDKVDIEAINAEITAAESSQEIVRTSERYGERIDEMQAKQNTLDNCDEQIAEIRTERMAALSDAKFPVEQMGYDADNKRLTYNGAPFAQASQAQKLCASAEIAMAQDAQLKVLFARDGSLLDEDHKKMLADLVHAKGWQMMLEVVDSEREGAGIYIEDGEAFGDMAESVEKAEES